MLPRLTAPLLETTAASPTQLPLSLSFKRALATQTNQASSSSRGPPIARASESIGHKIKGCQEYKRNDSWPSQHLRNGKIKLLTPYVLSQRVEASCREGQLNEAISLVKAAPLDAQNAIVWATLIRSVITAGRYQEAYRLFIDMKRRGIRPSSRTFSTLLQGYTQIDEWQNYPLQLDNVLSVYDQLKQYYAMVQLNGGAEKELSNIPYNQLIRIFGKAQRFQSMFDVFNAMPSKGPLAPDLHTFTALLTAIGNRQLSALAAAPAGEEGDEHPLPTANELAYKNASDAKLIWKQLLRVCPNPDSYAILAILKPLSRGRPSDHDFALDIAHEYLGFSRPGEPSIPAKLPPHEQTLEVARRLLGKLGARREPSWEDNRTNNPVKERNSVTDERIRRRERKRSDETDA